MLSRIFKNKIWSKTLFSFFTFIFVFLLVVPGNVFASDYDLETGIGNPPLSIAEQAAYNELLKVELATGSPVPTKALVSLHTNKVAPVINALIATTAFDVITYAFDTSAYWAAMWLANGGKGQESLVYPWEGPEAWGQMGLDVAGEAIGSLSKNLNSIVDTKFSICSPPDLFRISLALGLSNTFQPRAPKCEWQSIMKDYGGFLQNLQETAENPSEAAMNALAKSMRPGQSTLSFLTTVQGKVIDKYSTTQSTLFSSLLAHAGFKSYVDPVTGQVKTPAAYVQESVQAKLKDSDDVRKNLLIGMMKDSKTWELLGLRTLGIFVDTFASEIFKQFVSGLLPDMVLNIDPFNEFDSSSSKTTNRSIEEFYSGFFSTTRIGLENYSVLSEFSVCPAVSTGRQSNNCVIDSALFQAVARGESMNPITVSDALENRYLHGEWPLYPTEDVAHNQDPFCYTYGYCYGNLVKLRKARIIPIGWELAAASEQNSSTSPVTLKEVVDGFNDCNSEGGLDAAHPWCHLIDPNWILKYPSQQCRASMIGEQTLSSATIAARSGSCVDAPSCVSTDVDGNCQGYGYCVREKNTWDFQGDACPEEYATCLSFDNTDTGETGAWLFNTLDEDSCSAGNAGCLWYRSNKYLDNAGTVEDKSDDEYVWLPGDEIYLPVDHDNDLLYYNSSTANPRTTYSYDTGDGTDDNSYSNYSFEERIYLTSAAEECSDSEVGCSELYPISEGFSLNLLRNPSFETDENSDGVADYWSVTGASTTYDYYNERSITFSGDDSYYLNGATLSQENIPLQPNRFYTISAYAEGTTATNGASISVSLSASDNTAVSLVGYSSKGCSISGSTVTLEIKNADVDNFESFECTFTSPALADSRLHLIGDLTIGSTANIYVDSLQLEVGGTSTNFHEGYGGGEAPAEYLQIPPVWLGCQGLETDPADCDNYAKVCSSTDVGCTLYTPADGDPAVPAVISEKDQCPEACVGYATYKQEATDYDTAEFPLYFIADSAETCSSSVVGCDEFTNLENEEVEAYSYLRACVLPAINSGEVYFTWQGSDQNGYQLVSYQLLSSNLGASDIVQYTQDTDGDSAADFEDPDYDGDGIDDVGESHGRSEMQEQDYTPGNAPCTIWDMSSENTLVCADDTDILEVTDSCNENSDTITNPDCREFYDDLGEIHYRLFSETISISDDCSAYRKTDTSSVDCEASHGFWTASGECRYLLEPNESTACGLESAGCREYTGGSSRNASMVLSEQFEGGSYENYEQASLTSGLAISNESVAVDGHSLRVTASSVGGGVETLQDYYNADKTTTCATTGGCDSINKVCTVDYGAESCGALVDSLVEGKTYVLKFWAKGSGNIGVALTEQGGTSTIHDLVDPTKATTTKSSLTTLALNGSWQMFELGPLDTASFVSFNDNAVLGFYSLETAVTTFYIDNIELEQTEENLTLIKNSWVTPSTCDQTPAGASSEQYYLGCEEYSDQDDATYFIYQFENLCSEDAVGCNGFYNTQNSVSAYTKVYNVTCYNDKDSDGIYAYLASDPEAEDVVTSATSCTMSGSSACTIPVGYNSCQFDYDGNLPTPLPANIVLGPEATVILADEVEYYVSDDDFSCTEDYKGCTEYGQPTFSSDQTVVESFGSVYLLNQPDDYENSLCAHGELFCGSWLSSDSTNYYFKNPGEKTCEYKTGVAVGNASYSGWFRVGTNEFCYGVVGNSGYCSENTSTGCDQDADCALAGVGDCIINVGSYIVGGDFSGIWRDGDTAYDGWAGACGGYDLCSEFIEPLDTKEGTKPEGASYFYLNNGTINNEESTSTTESCDGLVSLENGCVLFKDTMSQELNYSSSPSYLVSEHADLFFGEDPRSPQEPISCSEPEDAFYTLTTGNQINVCNQRCLYSTSADNEITNLSVTVGPDNVSYFGGACVDNNDCQLGFDTFGQEVEGTCFNLDTDGDKDLTSETFPLTLIVYNLSSFALTNDTNQIIKVYRDRECAEWLACSSSHASWDDRENKWVDVCEDIGMCDEYSVSGTEGGECSDWTEQEPTVLDVDRYTARDISWYGLEYSGFAIPNQLPVEFYEQVSLIAGGYCTDGSGNLVMSDDSYFLHSCNSDDDCTTAGITSCTAIDDGTLYGQVTTAVLDDRDYLVYPAGSCRDVDEGENCTVGFCTDTGKACSGDKECRLGDCIVGYCQAAVPDSFCNSAADCSAGYICEDSECTYVITTSSTSTRQKTCTIDSDCGIYDTVDVDTENDATCEPGVLAKTGSCYDNNCLVGLDGLPFAPDNGESMICRGYPESMSPFPPSVVSEWIDPEDLLGGVISSETEKTEDIISADQMDIIPYTYINGFNDANVCSPTYESIGTCSLFPSNKCSDSVPCGTFGTCEYKIEVTNDCSCSYQKVAYGDGLITKYYPLDTPTGQMLSGICSGGDIPGSSCTVDTSDDDESTDDPGCNPGDPEGDGVCEFSSRKDEVYGWDGFCVERDSSVQLYGSSSTNDQPCLTWLPVDQLRGSRDAYANDMDAGFDFSQNYYYCTEVGYYADLYPTGTTLNSDGTVLNLNYACATSLKDQDCSGHITGVEEDGLCSTAPTDPDISDDAGFTIGFNCSYGQYGTTSADNDYCLQNAYCPSGYVALVGSCDQDMNPDTYPRHDGTRFIPDTIAEPIVCYDESGYRGAADARAIGVGFNVEDDVIDCPYFCIPDNSYHIQGNDTGESCIEDLDNTFNNDEFVEGREDNPSYYGVNKNGTTYYAVGDLFNERGAPGGSSADHLFDPHNWNYEETGDTDQPSTKTKFMDCVARGVPVGDPDFGTNPVDDEYIMGVTNGYSLAGKICPSAGSCSIGYISDLVGNEDQVSYGLSYRMLGGKLGQCSKTSAPCLTTTDCDRGDEYCEINSVERGSFKPYLGCYELVKVSGPPETGSGEGNKAWTNRLWEGNPNPFSTTTTDIPGYEIPFVFSPDSYPTIAGQAMFDRFFYNSDIPTREGEMKHFDDAWPLPVSTCDNNVDDDLGYFGAGLSTNSPSGTCVQYEYPTAQQYKYNAEDGLLTISDLPYNLAASYEFLSLSAENSAVQGLVDADNFDEFGNSTNGNAGSIISLLQQLFAKVYEEVWQYNWDEGSDATSDDDTFGSNGGKYVKKERFSDTYRTLGDSADISDVGDGYGSGYNVGATPPVIAAIGTCYGSECLEGTENEFSVNGAEGDILTSNGGNYHATVQFFAWANDNQMPLRNVVVDWGDGERNFDYTDYYWPLDSYSGSKEDTNYYRNYRGLAGPNVEECGGGFGDLDEWGLTSSACKTAYFGFEHDYYCSEGLVEELSEPVAFGLGAQTCRYADDDTGRLLNSPCTGGEVEGATDKCVFQPRVHVKDNWGWCTGYCTAGSAGGDGCYDGGSSDNNECDIENCPSDGSGGGYCIDDVDGTIDNPWLNYGGVIILDWKN